MPKLAKSPAPVFPQWICEVLEGLPPLVTRKEAAALLRVSTKTIDRRVAAGLLEAVRFAEGGTAAPLIRRDSLARLLLAASGEVAA